MLPSVIDCHTHIDNHWLKYDAVPLKQRLRRCDATGVEAMVVSVYATRENLEEHLDHLCAVFDSFDVRLAVTLGYPPPSRAADLNAPPGHSTAALDAARRAARRPEIVGIGEVGMDYYWPQKEWMPEGEVLPLETEQDRVEAGLSEHPELERCLRAQADEFRRWIDLAQELDLPLVVHERDARNDTDRVITASGIDPNRVVYHCFTGTPDQALALADRGFWVSVPSSAVKREPFRSIAATAPLGRMLSETDAPYHSPMAGLWSRLYQEARAEVEHGQAERLSERLQAVSARRRCSQFRGRRDVGQVQPRPGTCAPPQKQLLQLPLARSVADRDARCSSSTCSQDPIDLQPDQRQES